ncbi:cyclase [Candidatus Villigracilis affinis]|uniref:cyclase n=1 Tax=Candidatus Villigracilis affinis TaxID=3140682 RepID=UPI001E0D1191|nr:cyclase [Anaerolineales bacterium]MBL0345279.1 cyclase [Anaerolineales bacterium]
MRTMIELLRDMSLGTMSNTAYDTAWVARLGDIDHDMSSHALEWIGENQLHDGSWGARNVYYYHDRVVSTLSAMIALTHQGRRARDKKQIENGLLALEQITDNATQGLSSAPSGPTVGFELIAPTLVAEAEKLGIIKQQGDRILGRLKKLREIKMAKLAGLKINRHITAVFSAEMAGTDSTNLLDIDHLQEPNGSVGCSPSSTAYFARYLKPGDEKALNYLKSISKDGGVPNFAPFDIFERCWVLWNLSLLDNFKPEETALIESHMDYLSQRWVPKTGIGFASDCAMYDSDDTSVTQRVLLRFGREADIESILSYEEEKYFRCVQHEASPSVGVNIHILGALKLAGFDRDHPSIQKILNFLRETRNEGGYWFDKWHVSPYYITSHVVIECLEYDLQLCQGAIDWILKNQSANGAWGYFGFPTAEETAFCLQALKIWRRNGNPVPEGRIEMASMWLSENAKPPYPWMWIAKTLYYPELIIQSSIMTALAL